MQALLALVGLLGLAAGSFGNVVIHRVPRGESLLRPGSHCPQCKAPVRHRHNLPVLGWLLLRGRCAGCRRPIGIRYPLVEIGTAALFVLLTARIGGTPALPAYLFLAAIAVPLAVIDLDVRRLPNAIVLPSYPVLAALLAGASANRHEWWPLARSGIGAAALFAFYLVLALAYPSGMGFGDVKLAGLLGGVLAYLSWSALVVGAFLGFLLGAVVGVAVIAAGRGSRKTALPFGPAMLAGALLAVLLADPIAGWYGQFTPTG